MILSPSFILQSSVALSLMVDMRVWVISRAERTAPAPDTLDWEDLELRYSEFIAWLAQGNIDEFYSSMRWTNWRESAKNVEFDKAILIYPFLWSEEVNIETASKSIVPFDELFATNMEYREKFGIGD